MLRPLFAALILSTAASAVARTGPEIAYSIGKEIYLVDSDGTDNVRLYRGKGNGIIDSVALKPGGGLIAFVDNWVLKFATYSAAGVINGPILSLPGCYRQFGVHFSPDGQSVIYGEICSGTETIKQVAVPTAANPSPTPQTLVTNTDLLDVGDWDAGGQSFVYSTSDIVGFQIRRHVLGGSDDAIVSVANGGGALRYPALSPDGARVTTADSSSSVQVAGLGFLDEFSTSTGQPLRSNFVRGKKGDYSPSGDRLLFVETDGKTTYLRVLRPDGLRHNVAKSTAFAAFNDIDWGQ